MIGSGFRKYARKNGLKVGNGIAYGSLRGYAVSLCEGGGWKRMTVNTRIANPTAKAELMAQMEDKGNKKRFSIQETQFGSGKIVISFFDTIGTLKKIEAFTTWLFPLLDGAGAEKANICDACGLEMGNSEVWKLIDETAYHMHPACGEKMAAGIRQAEQEQTESRTGSYLLGLVGALLGALLGAVVWAVVYELGYIASIVGLLIAFLAVKGYELLHGRQGAGMTVIILAAVIFGVVAGNLGAYYWELLSLVMSGELPISAGQIPGLLFTTLVDEAVFGQVLRDLAMGLFFALLGAFGAIAKTAKTVGKTKIIDLE